MAIDYKKNSEGKGSKRYLSGGPRDQQVRLRNIQPVVGNSSDAVVEELRNQIRLLTDALSKKPKVGGEYTSEEVDEEIRKAVAGAIAETKNKYENKVNKLTDNNRELNKEVERLKAGLVSIKKEAEFERKEAIVRLEASYEKTVAELKVSLDAKERLIEDLRKDKTKEISELTDKIRELASSLSVIRGIPEVVDKKRPKMEEVFVDPLEKGAGENLVSHINVKDLSFREKVKVDSQVDKLKGLIGKLPSIGTRK